MVEAKYLSVYNNKVISPNDASSSKRREFFLDMWFLSIPYILKEKHYNIWGSHVSSPQWVLEFLEKYVGSSKYIISFLLN